ncbi:hypothetical protein D3C78_1682440 [compost metagenome]
MPALPVLEVAQLTKVDKAQALLRDFGAWTARLVLGAVGVLLLGNALLLPLAECLRQLLDHQATACRFDIA